VLLVADDKTNLIPGEALKEWGRDRNLMIVDDHHAGIVKRTGLTAISAQPDDKLLEFDTERRGVLDVIGFAEHKDSESKIVPYRFN
jgi:hypothetical protein